MNRVSTVNNDNSHTSTAMLDATGGSFDQSTIAPLVQLSSNQLEEKLFNSQDNQPPLSKSQIEWLSDAEYDSYLKSKASAKLVDVVIGDALLSGYKFIGDDEQTIFIDKSTQATYRLTGNATAKPLINGVEWGVWDANQIKHQGYEDIVDNSNQSLAWTQVTKYDLAQLGANGLDSINFTPNQEHFFGRDSLGGELSGASGSLNVNLSNGQLIFNDIQLTYTLNEDEPTSVWYLSSSDFPFDPELVQGNFEVHLNAGEGADRQITNTQFNVFLSGTTAEGLPAGAISQHLLKGQYMDGNDLKEIWANGLLFWQNQQEYPGGG